MNIRNAIALLGLLAFACTTNGGRSDLVITKVVEATGGGTGPCIFSSSTDELALSTIDPAANVGEVAAVVKNNLLDPSAINPDLYTNSAQFQPHQVVVSYEALPRAPGAAAPYVIPQQIIAAGGVVVPQGGTGTVAAALFLPGVLPAGFAAGDIIRTSFHVEGKLADGRTVSTSQREYLFRICTGCATNVCL